MKIYRFRSIDALLDKYHELENQTIYFASPDELNDPMEGLRDIVWSGDKIVWEKFFKHYTLCLHLSFLKLKITLNSKEFKGDDIPILNGWNHLSTPDALRLFNDIWREFRSLPYIPEIIEALASSNRKIRHTELKYYLQMIHPFFLPEIKEIYIEHGLIPESERDSLPDELSVATVFKSILASIKLFDEARTEDEINAALQQIAMIDYSNRLKHLRIIRQHKHRIPIEAYWNSRQLVFADFPMVYLKEIERLLYPKWYTACFVEHYHNSSVWGHYAGDHKGVCLIFESNGFELYQGAGNSVCPTQLAKIKYITKPAEVDFFRSIGRLTGHDIREHWYTDDEGNISDCASHIPRDGDMDSAEMVEWRNRHSITFYRDITAKTKDWEYEQEYRLTLEDGLSEFKGKKSRTLRYSFSSLKGIIFGINTSDEHRLRIIEIIEKKCEDCERTDFKFYQAYYSHETSDIQKYEIQLS